MKRLVQHWESSQVLSGKYCQIHFSSAPCDAFDVTIMWLFVIVSAKVLTTVNLF